MLTPQEVSSHVFSKSVLGGYNMAMVDDFLDVLTADYIALYNDNAILKNKLKVLSDTVEEYRATDEAMRKTLLSAQQMADTMIHDAEQKKADLLKDAEAAAYARIDELRAQVAAEEARLQSVRESTATYVEKVDTLFQAQELTLRELTKLGPDPKKSPEARMDEAVQDIENNLSQIIEQESKAAEPPKEEEQQPQPAPAGAVREREIGLESTRRFDDLRFGKDYEIR